MAKLMVVGSGYVGLTTGVAFSSLGHEVTVFDVDKDLVRSLNSGQSHIVEAGVPELLCQGLGDGTLRFVDDLELESIPFDFIFVCVQTPENPDGSSNLTFVEEAIDEINRKIPFKSVVIIKSTVPVWAAKDIKSNLRIGLAWLSTRSS
jgi:UDPglucose 6-dehydrogenase